MAVGRDVLQSFSESARAVGQALSAFGSGVKVYASSFGNASIKMASISISFIQQTSRAYYNILGQYTFPIEQQYTHTVPPNPQDLNTLGSVALTIPVPVTIAAVAVSATVVPLVGNSVISVAKGFPTFFNLAVFDSESMRMASPVDDRSMLRKIYGAPGYLFGGFWGVMITACMASGRVISNNFKSFGWTTYNAGSTILKEKNSAPQQEFKDKRHFFKKYIMGFPGFIGGAVFGTVGGILLASVRPIAVTFGYPVNFVLHKDNQIVFPPPDKFTWLGKTCGLPGYLIGSVSGVLIGMPLVMGGRLLTNSARSVGRCFVPMVNSVLHTDEKVENFSADTRNWAGHAYGFPGVLVGVTAGSLSVIAIVMGRIVTNSYTSMTWSFSDAMAAVLRREDDAPVLETDTRHPFRKYAMGFPGVLVGGISGALCGTVVANVQSMGGAIAVLANCILHTDNQIPLPERDTRMTRAKVISIPGLIAGGVAGVVIGMPVVIVGRIISNSLKSIPRAFVMMVNPALNTEDKIQDFPPDPRNLAGKAFGMPGLLMGSVGGVFGIIGIAAGRIITNSIDSMSLTFSASINLFYPSEEHSDSLANDARAGFRKYGLGLPGILLGGTSGVLAGYGLSNLDSMTRHFLNFANVVLHANDQIKLPDVDLRSEVIKKLSAPGVIVGVVSGILVGMPVIFAGRVFSNSCKTLARCFVPTVNSVLHQENSLKPFDPDSRNNYGIAFGAPGYLLAIPVCAVSVTAIVCARVLSNTFKTSRLVSGAILNCAVRRVYFKGLNADRRSQNEKLMGGLGYLLASPVIVLGASILLIRKSPIIILLSCGVVASPLVASYKGLLQLNKMLRGIHDFVQVGEQNLQSRKDVIQGFKNIYSSLTALGSLKEGDQLAINADGSRRYGTFFRRSVTFNARTITEKTLDVLMAHYNRFEDEKEGGFGVDFFAENNPAFQQALDEVNEYYDNDCFSSIKEKKDNRLQVEKVAKFVRSYMNDRIQKGDDEEEREVVIVDVGPPGGLSWRECFFGNQDNAHEPYVPAQGVEQVAESYYQAVPQAHGQPVQEQQDAGQYEQAQAGQVLVCNPPSVDVEEEDENEYGPEGVPNLRVMGR